MADVVQVLTGFFTQVGVPETLISDNGPQFCLSEFHLFAREWAFTVEHSSLCYSHSNGLEEGPVKIMKNLVTTTSTSLTSPQFRKVLLEHRNVPRQDGMSPAQRLFGMNLKTVAPVSVGACMTVWKKKLVEANKKVDELVRKRESTMTQRPTLTQLGEVVRQ